MRKLLIGSLLILPIAGSADNELFEQIETKVVCGDTGAIVNALKKEYNESPLVAGITNDIAGSTMTLWTSKSGSTWTIIATKNNKSCVIGAGTELRVIRSTKMI